MLFRLVSRIRLWCLLLLLILVGCVNLSSSQRTTTDDCTTPDMCFNPANFIDQLLQEREQLKSIVNRLKEELQDQDKEIQTLRTNLNSAIGKRKGCATKSDAHTTTELALSTFESAPSTVGSTPSIVGSASSTVGNTPTSGSTVFPAGPPLDIQFIRFINNYRSYFRYFFLLGGNLISLANRPTPSEVGNITVYDAFNGSTVAVLSLPENTTGTMGLTVCRKDGYMFLYNDRNIWRGNISLGEDPTEITWELWTLYNSVSTYINFFRITDDCQEVHFSKSTFQELPFSTTVVVVEIRKYSDGTLLVSKEFHNSNFTVFLHDVVKVNERYFISYGENGSSYVGEFDDQLNLLSRFDALKGSGNSGVSYIYSLEPYDDENIFIVNNVQVLILETDFSSFVTAFNISSEVLELNYDPASQLLALNMVNRTGIYTAAISNKTLDHG